MNYALEELTKQRVKDIEFLSLLDGEAFIKALEYVSDKVLFYEIKNEILEHFKEEKHNYWEFAQRRFTSLEKEQRREIINKALKRVRRECLCEPKQKIALLSKKELKRAIKINYELESYYRKQGFTLKILKEQEICTKLGNNYDNGCDRMLTIELKNDVENLAVVSCNLLGFRAYKEDVCSNGSLYDFVLMAIDMLNKSQDYFEFEFSKDEE